MTQISRNGSLVALALACGMIGFGDRAKGSAPPRDVNLGTLGPQQSVSGYSSVSTRQFDVDPDAWTDGLILMLEAACVILECYEIQTPDVALAKQRIDLWMVSYDIGGVRNTLTAPQRSTYRVHVAKLFSHVLMDPGVLGTTLQSDFLTTLERIYVDLGGNRSDL